MAALPHSCVGQARAAGREAEGLDDLLDAVEVVDGQLLPELGGQLEVAAVVGVGVAPEQQRIGVARHSSSRVAPAQRDLTAHDFSSRAFCSSTSNVGRRPAQPELLEPLDQQAADRPVAVPLAVGRDDVPRRRVGAAALDRVLVGALELVPQRAVLEVGGTVLPVLGRVVEPRQKPLALLFGGDVQEALDDQRALGGEPLLEPVDGRVPPRPGAAVDELAHAHRDDVLVVRAVEDGEHAGRRELLADAPEEVVRELLGRRAAERDDVHAGGVDLADHVLDRAALARGVHPLEHEQHAARAAAAALRVELLLQRGDPLGLRGLDLLGGGLLAAESRLAARVDRAQVDGAPGRPQQCRRSSPSAEASRACLTSGRSTSSSSAPPASPAA